MNICSVGSVRCSLSSKLITEIARGHYYTFESLTSKKFHMCSSTVSLNSLQVKICSIYPISQISSRIGSLLAVNYRFLLPAFSEFRPLYVYSDYEDFAICSRVYSVVAINLLYVKLNKGIHYPTLSNKIGKFLEMMHDERNESDKAVTKRLILSIPSLFSIKSRYYVYTG